MANTSEPPWVNKASGTATRNGTSSHTVSFGFTSTAGNMLVFICFGAVTHTEAGSTWTERAQPVSSGELSMFTKTSTGETSITINHNGSNYPMLWVAYEFLAGTSFTGVTDSNSSSETFPTLSSLPGIEQVVIAVRGRTAPSTSETGASTVWDGSMVEDADLFAAYSSTDGGHLTVAHQRNVTATSITPSATTTYTGTWTIPDRERIVAALNVAVPPNGSATNLFTSQTPALTNVNEGSPVTIATTVWFSAAGTITAGRFFAPTTVGSGTYTLALWEITADDVPSTTGAGTLLGTASFGTLTGGAWNTATFSTPISVAANTAYRIGVRTSEGRYTATGGFFNTNQIVNAGIHAPQTATNPTSIGYVDNGSFIESITTYPYKTFNGNLYFVDVTWTMAATTPSPATVAPLVSIPAVVAGGPPPGIVMGRDRPVKVNGTVQLDATVSPVGGDTVTAYAWTVLSGSGSLTNATTATPTYNAPSSGTGTATIRLQATGSSGGVGSATMTVAYAPNIVAAENQLTGTARVDWDLAGGNLGGINTLQGFADGFSYNKTSTVNFKIAQSNTAGWSAQVFRLGYYGGTGARLIAALGATTGSQLTASQAQPTPGDADPDTTKLSADCSNWSTTLTWTPPAWAPSGIYILHLYATGGGASHVMFVLRDDTRAADLMFMPADSTWNAYNAWGGMDGNQYTGNSLYYGTPVDQYNNDCAHYVSYNRPVVVRGSADAGREYGAVEWSNFFTSEYPALRFVERNGIDVKYYACLDAAGDATGSFLLGENGLGAVKAAMAVGHSEYWSDKMRAGWERAKNRGVSMFFCASNEVFWRLVGTDLDSEGRPRKWECQKSTINGRGNTRPEWTGTWRDSDGAGKGGNQPENTLTGTIFVVNGPDLRALVVPFTGGYSAQPLWRNTTVASLSSGTWSSPSQILGFEWDTYGPAGTTTTAATWIAAPHPRARYCSDVTYTVASQVLTDAGDVYNTGDVTHRLVVHPGGAGAIVFGTGTMNWALGLDPANFYQVGNDNMSTVIQQATLNMLTDMGAAPVTLMSGMTQPSPVDWYPDVVTSTINATVTIPGPSIPASTAPTTIAAVAALAAPAAQAGAKPVPATVAAGTTIPSAAAQGGIVTAPATIAATTTMPTATAAGGAGTLPATVAASTAIAAPTIVFGATPTPAVLAATAAVPAPAAQGGSVLLAETLAVTAALADPEVQLGLRITPATIAATTAVAAVVFESSALPAPVTVAVLTVITGEAIPEGSLPSPATAAVTAAMAAPSVFAGSGATVTAATLAAVASLPAAQVFTGTESTAGASTLVAVVVIAPVSLSVSRTVVPATVAAGVSFPTATPQASLSVNIEPAALHVTVLIGTAIPNSIVPRIVAWKSYVTDTTGR